MGKRKFEKGDIVTLSEKAPKWLVTRVEEYSARIDKIEVSRLDNNYDVSSYTICLFDADHKTLTYIQNVRSTDLVLDTIGSGNKSISKILQKISENNKAIEKIQLENQRLNERIQLIESLEIDNVDQRLLDIALVMVEVSNEQGTKMDLKTAYNISASLRDKRKTAAAFI
jgi:Asp-tRNA(Asn)/Glu-tRNA(Gln) amidotransferase B subunit